MNGNARELPNKRPLSVDLLFLGLISLLAVGSWVTFDVYRAITVTTIPRVLQRQIRPLQSKIDEDLLASIKARRQFSESELTGVTPKAYIPLEDRPRNQSLILTPTPTPSEILVTPVATGAAGLTPTPVATQSGEINL